MRQSGINWGLIGALLFCAACWVTMAAGLFAVT